MRLQMGYGFFYLLSLVFVSHILLPAIKTEEALPFFTWRLFSKPRAKEFRDLRLDLGETTVFLSEASESLISRGKRQRLWYLTQITDHKDHFSPYLPKTLASFDICTIKVGLPNYVVAYDKSRWVQCNDQ